MGEILEGRSFIGNIQLQNDHGKYSELVRGIYNMKNHLLSVQYV